MPRHQYLPYFAGWLVLGVSLGWGLARLVPGPSLSAQAEPGAGLKSAVAAVDDPYDQLARQY